MPRWFVSGYREVFVALEAGRVPYVVGGGAAVVLQGPFADLRAQASLVDLDGLRVPVASVEHLIAMKRAVGRPRDLEDIAALERLRDLP